MENPIIKAPQFFNEGFFEKVKAKPKPTKGNAIALILTLNPKIVINHAVIVVPILAPIITLIASVSVNNEALEKLTTIKVVADDDCITEVIKNPVKIPMYLLEVMVANIFLIRSPAKLRRASLITFIPKRKRPRDPNNCRKSVNP